MAMRRFTYVNSVRVARLKSTSIFCGVARTFSTEPELAADIASKFEERLAQLGELEYTPSNEEKLKLYAYYKLIRSGGPPDANGRPSFMDPVGQAKYDAWANASSKLSVSDAMKKYIEYVDDVLEKHQPASVTTSTESKSSSGNYTAKKLSEVMNPASTKDITATSYNTVKCTLNDNGVLQVKLNRPDRGNAINLEMWNDLGHVFRTINEDARVRVVVMCGNAKSFSTGIDLGMFADMQALQAKEPCPSRQREGLANVIQWLQDVISGPEHCRVPVIAAISGHCIGGAVDLITACDIRYATQDAQFCIKETDLGMVADIGTLQRLPKLIGDMQCRELAYSARVFDADEAKGLGLVLRTFDNYEQLLQQAHRLATTIASKSPLTIRGTKETLLYTRDHKVDDALNQIKMHNAAYLMSTDLMEAMTATMSKREPKFSD